MPILATKLFSPSRASKVVLRPGLVERLNEGLRGKLTLISAPAGFGKTAIACEWIADCKRPSAWLSLDEGDSDCARFLTYLVAALRTVNADIGAGVLAVLQSPQQASTESVLTSLVNEISAMPDDFILVLDDYHAIDAKQVDDAMAFLLEHAPPRMHVVIVTREDPNLPLARWRARGQLSELRAADLRFTADEAAAFLNQAMGLGLPQDSVTALESRTEGWIAGLQMAAISLRGHPDAAGFIGSFTGSHRYILDYLLEEVLSRQPAPIQSFLLQTSILGRMCGPLCDAVTGDASMPGIATLEQLERANMFVVPLDDQRRWYRYHHLFADALRQRLPQSLAATGGARPGTSVKAARPGNVSDLHARASAWYEENGLELEAFHHAAAAHDLPRAERLIEGGGMPLYFRGALIPVLSWLKSLPKEVMDARPWLWTAFASATLATGRAKEATEQLRAAESALEGVTLDGRTRDVIGRIAAVRATLALGTYSPDAVIAQSRRALEYLDPANLAFRTSTGWKMGVAYWLQGDPAAAGRAYAEVLSASRASGNTMFGLLALAGLGGVQEAGNELRSAAASYRSVLEQAGNVPSPFAACDASLGLARIRYEWNDLEAALRHWRQSVPLAQSIENMGRHVDCDLLLVRLKLAQGGVAEADTLLSKAEEAVNRHAFRQYTTRIAAARVQILIRQGDLAAALELAQAHGLPLSQARVHLAQGDPAAALAVLEPFRRQAEEKGWQDQRLRAIVLQALALHANGETVVAIRSLGEALALAEPNGFIRTFVDEGAPMARLLAEAAARGNRSDYAAALLNAFPAGERGSADASPVPSGSLIEALSPRELEVLRLVAQGLSNEEIGERLFLSLSTVKGHNRKIFDKLQVQRRTEAVARARELHLL